MLFNPACLCKYTRCVWRERERANRAGQFETGHRAADRYQHTSNAHRESAADDCTQTGELGDVFTLTVAVVPKR